MFGEGPQGPEQQMGLEADGGKGAGRGKEGEGVLRESDRMCIGLDMKPFAPGVKTSIVHVAVTDEERRKMAQRALAEHRPLSNWARVQLLKAFEPTVSDENGEPVPR